MTASRWAVPAAVVLSLAAAMPAWSASHLWVINEVFSNADGTIQFVEMWTPAPNEASIGGKAVHADGGSSAPFAANLPPNSTADTYLLLGTPAFAAQPGAPAPDLMIPANFLDTTGDTVQWHIYAASVLSYGAGQLPTDGVQSLDKDGTTGAATPTNFAGDSFPPPGVDGLAVTKILPTFPDGSRLSLSWNVGSCVGAAQYHLVYGLGSNLPSVPGGTYVLEPPGAGQCAIAGPPKIWSGVPNPAADPTRFLWFLILADDGSQEGAWGADSNGDERTGPMIGGASGQCGIFVKDLGNACP